LDRTKAEIILNEHCMRDCPMRARHYEAIARMHKCLGSRQGTATAGSGDAPAQRRAAEQELVQLLALCPAVPTARQFGKRRRNCTLTRNELRSLYGMGFRHFKIQGRGVYPRSLIYNLVHYTLEPGCAAQLVYEAVLPTVDGLIAATQAREAPTVK
jgi:hypothetical protein